MEADIKRENKNVLSTKQLDSRQLIKCQTFAVQNLIWYVFLALLGLFYWMLPFLFPFLKSSFVVFSCHNIILELHVLKDIDISFDSDIRVRLGKWYDLLNDWWTTARNTRNNNGAICQPSLSCCVFGITSIGILFSLSASSNNSLYSFKPTLFATSAFFPFSNQYYL